MDKYWKDYIAMRPGTMGGENAIAENKRTLSAGVSYPAPAQLSEVPSQKRAVPRVPYQFKRSDLVIAVAVFVVTWLVLWRSSNMGGGTAAAIGFFTACVAARWWRQLLAVIVVVLALAIYFHSR